MPSPIETKAQKEVIAPLPDVTLLTPDEFALLPHGTRFEVLNCIKQECVNLYVSEKEARSLGLHAEADGACIERIKLQSEYERLNQC